MISWKMEPNEIIYPCTVNLLSETVKCSYLPSDVGKDLLDYVCNRLELDEKDIWGIRYVDAQNNNQRQWLDLGKTIKSQVKSKSFVKFQFRVKIYPPEPYKLTDVICRRQVFLQVLNDLATGRLPCSSGGEAALFLGYIIQYKLGDYNYKKHLGNYVLKNQVYNQDVAMEMQAMELHKNHLKEMSKGDVEDLLLRTASSMKQYGVDTCQVEVKGKSLTLWYNHRGIEMFYNDVVYRSTDWMNINKISHESKTLTIILADDEIINMLCVSKPECDYVYEGIKAHFNYFTSISKKSTTGTVGSDSDDERNRIIKSLELEDVYDDDDEENNHCEAWSNYFSSLSLEDFALPLLPSAQRHVINFLHGLRRFGLTLLFWFIICVAAFGIGIVAERYISKLDRDDDWNFMSNFLMLRMVKYFTIFGLYGFIKNISKIKMALVDESS